jgi:hypothetical protein
MQQEPTPLPILAERATAALRELVEAAESEAARLAGAEERVRPPAETFALVRTLERWTARLRDEPPDPQGRVR